MVKKKYWMTKEKNSHQFDFGVKLCENLIKNVRMRLKINVDFCL